MKIKRYKEIHPLHKVSGTGNYSIGKWHYIYININNKHKISLVKMKIDNQYIWEAWGFRMHNERRFKTRKEAERYIYRILSKK